MTKKTSVNINMDLSFESARHLKFQAGIDRHRGGDGAKEFHGELCDEAWQECLDLYSYLEQIEQERGLDLSLRKSIVKAIAMDLKRIHERHLAERL